MLKSVAGRRVPFNPLRLPGLPIRSRRIGLRTIQSIGGKVAVCPFEFYDGLETGDLSKWRVLVADSYEIITDPTHHGDYAAKALISNGGLEHTVTDLEDYYFIRFYFRLTGVIPTGGSSGEFLRVYDEELAIYIITGGAGGGPGVGGPRFELQNLISGAWADGTTTLEVDTWYCVVLKAQADNADATHKLWLDGEEEISLDDDTEGYSHDNFNISSIYWTGNSYTGRAIIDCFLCGYTEPSCDYYPACGV